MLVIQSDSSANMYGPESGDKCQVIGTQVSTILAGTLEWSMTALGRGLESGKL